jgi:molybdenum cofactor synthesis domain-containing protein
VSANLSALVVVVSDSVFQGASEDRSGALLIELLSVQGLRIEPLVMVPDEIDLIQASVRECSADVIVLTGGTGVSPRDNTPEAILPLIEKRLHGVEETIRSHGMKQTPNAMLSRTVVGTRGRQLILCLPGSPAAVKAAVEAVFPTVLHVFDVFDGKRH